MLELLTGKKHIDVESNVGDQHEPISVPFKPPQKSNI